MASGIEAENNREAASVAIGAGLSGITRHDAPAGGTVAGGTPEPTIGADVTYQRDVSLQRTYDLAYAQCMSKGNQVPGFAQLKRVPPPY